MKSFAFVLAVCLSLFAPAFGRSHDMHQHPDGESIAAPPGVHGMVIFGKDTIYASHIPMFMVPHDWQAQFEVRFEHESIDANAFFKDVQARHLQQKLYTFLPKPFVLPDLLSGKITNFSGDLYEGNFESGGILLLKNISLNVVKVMNVAHLKETTVPSAHISYLRLGEGRTSYFAHKIVAPASFDQLIQVLWLKSNLPTKSEISLDLEDAVDNRLKAGRFYKLEADKLQPVASKEAADLQIIGEFSCLLGPDFYLPCE